MEMDVAYSLIYITWTYCFTKSVHSDYYILPSSVPVSALISTQTTHPHLVKVGKLEISAQ